MDIVTHKINRIICLLALSVMTFGISTYTSAALISVQPTTPIVVLPNGNIILDIDSDGTNDFDLDYFHISYGSGSLGDPYTTWDLKGLFHLNGSRTVDTLLGDNSIVGPSSTFSTETGANLQTYFEESNRVASSVDNDGLLSSSPYPNRGIIGIEFLSSGNTHYGWIEIENFGVSSQININSWAWESDINTAVTISGTGIEAPPAAVPLPPSALLFLSGLVFLFRNKIKK